MQFTLPLAGAGGARARPLAHTACIYCGAKAATREHVPPKTLLAKPYPANLRTVPACSPCNRSWSLDEQYLAIVLAHVSDNPRFSAALDPGGTADRALAGSPGLDDRIAASLVADEGGRVSFAPELPRIARVAVKTAYGLYSLKYGADSETAQFGAAGVWGPGEEPPEAIIAAQWQWPGIRRKRWTVVQKDVFSFLFAKGWMAGDPPLYCLIDFGGTLLAAIACPPPFGKEAGKRLRALPWK